MKVSKRGKKTTVETMAQTPPVNIEEARAPKVEVRKKARPTDDVISARPDDISSEAINGHNGHNGHAEENGHTFAMSHQIDDAERRRLIAEAAYFRAVRRNFANGTAEGDWLEAEAEVGALLSQHR